MNLRTPLRAALRNQPSLARASCRRYFASTSSTTQQSTSTSTSRRWQYGAITFLTLSTLVLSRSLVHSDAEKKRSNETEHDDPYDEKHHPDEPKSFPHAAPTEGLRVVSSAELSNHNTEAAGYWVAIDGTVWDVTEWITSGAHPGGSKVLIQQTGRDATQVYRPLHPPGTIEENMDPKFKIGIIDPSGEPLMSTWVFRRFSALTSYLDDAAEANTLAPEQSDAEKKTQEARDNMMGVDGMVNLDDFEKLARTILSPAALAYYESGSDDEWTLHENNNAYRRIRFRPRVLRKVKDVDTSTSILGVKSTVPFFIAPAALAKLGHPDGEVNLTKGA